MLAAVVAALAVALVPPGARLDRVWPVPGAQQLVAASHFRGRHVVAWGDDTRYALTVWTRAGARWWPQTLVRASPFPFDARSVRVADVTHDGRPDLLVSVACIGCNHGAEAISIFATFGRGVRRIYGHGSIDVGKGLRPTASVPGTVVIETCWGAQGGVVWFDSGGVAATHRTMSFMRWTRHGWRPAPRIRVVKDECA